MNTSSKNQESHWPFHYIMPFVERVVFFFSGIVWSSVRAESWPCAPQRMPLRKVWQWKNTVVASCLASLTLMCLDLGHPNFALTTWLFFFFQMRPVWSFFSDQTIINLLNRCSRNMPLNTLGPGPHGVQ